MSRGIRVPLVAERHVHAQPVSLGDQDATGLDGATPSGRYVEFTYTDEKLNGSSVTNAKASTLTE